MEHSFKYHPKLRDALRMHERYAKSYKNAIRRNLGDGYLCVRNAVYRNVRDAALSLKYRYSENNDFYYREMKPFSLVKILESRTLPCSDNIEPLRAYEKSYPGKIRLTPPAFAALPRNNLLHESAHCVAHHACFGKAEFPKLRRKNLNEVALKVILCESFANAVETVGSAFIDSPWHDFFYRFNSYSNFDTLLRREARKIAKSCGKRALLLFVTMAFMDSNLLSQKISVRRTKVWRKRFLSEKIPLKTCLSISDFSLNLSWGFRLYMIKQHFDLVGIPDPYGKISAISMDGLADDPIFLGLLDRLAAYACGGVNYG